jgi:peptidoglycan/LPS O-acetylase OafA/YrhL
LKQDALYIPSLDGIRAASVMIVFLAHAGLNEWVPGNFGVTVFFFLSGYLITTLLRVEAEKTGTISLKAFYLRRVLRIMPPMYAVLALAAGLTLLGVLRLESGLNYEALLAQVFHLTNYYIIEAGWWAGWAPGTWIFWSLAVEEHFYLLFPLVYIALRRFLPGGRRQLLVILGVCALVLAWRVVLVVGLDAIKERTYIATDTRIDSILFGCALAVFGNPWLDRTRIGERWWKFALLPLGALAIVLSVVVRNPEYQETVRYTVQGLGLVPFFVVAVRYPDWLPCRALNVGWVKFVGLLSYALYLVHPSVLWGVGDRFGRPRC